MTQALARPASVDYAASCLAANITALGLTGKTLDRVLATAPRGRVIRLADGNPAIDLDGQLLGAPGDEASRRQTLADVSSLGDGIVVALGLGMGHALRELRERTRAKVIVFEPDPGILRRVLEWGPCDLGGITVVSDLVDLKMHWAIMIGSRPRAALVRTPGYEKAYAEADRALGEAIGALVRNVQINENTHHLRSRIWLGDIFENLPRMAGTTPFMALEGKYRGVPAFIVGAGPSLDKNGPLLRDAVEKGIVIAVNTSGRALVRHGVTPQVLACIESIDLSGVLGALPFIDDVVRAFSLSGSPAHLVTGKGPLLPIFENLQSFEPLIDLTGHRGLPVGASVTTAALSLAERLGCTPIVLVGQDLAFSGNQVYASGTSYDGSKVHVAREGGRLEHQWSKEVEQLRGAHHAPLPKSEPLLETTAWGGQGTVATSAGFSAVRGWLEAAADLMRRTNPELRFINATEGGARIANFEERSLADVLSTLPSHAITSKTIGDDASALNKPTTTSQIVAWARRQRVLVHRAHKSAVLVERLARQGLGVLATDDGAAVKRAFAKLQGAEQDLKRHCSAMLFIEAWGVKDLQLVTARSEHATIENSARAEAEHALRTEAELARVIAESAGELERRLRAVSIR